MSIKTFRPVTKALRFTQLNRPEEISAKRPERSLVEHKNKTGGRNVYGRLTSRRRGGGHDRGVGERAVTGVATQGQHERGKGHSWSSCQASALSSFASASLRMCSAPPRPSTSVRSATTAGGSTSQRNQIGALGVGLRSEA